MTDSDKRLTLVSTGLLAGLIAGLLTIVVPPFVHQLDAPFIGVLFDSLFIGDIFGVVLCVYFWVFPRRRSVVGSIGFVLSSTAAYILAWYTTVYSSEFLPSAQHMDNHPIAGAPVLAFVLGGTVGAFVVLLAALLFFSRENRVSRNFLHALIWCPVGGALGALGWATGPSLGVWIATAIGQRELLSSPGYADFYYDYSIFLVWQAGIGLTLGWLFSRQPVEAPASSAPAPVAGPNRVARIARIALFAAAAIVFALIARREFPERYQSAKWQRAYKKHVAERPPMPPQPAEKPPLENPPNPIPEPSRENLPEVQLVAPEKMLILHHFGGYIPGGVLPEPIRKAPASTYYLVRYAIPDAPLGKTGPVVSVQVNEYPNAAWAQYEIFQRANGIDLANSTRLVKFGNRIYREAGQATEVAEGQDGAYTWRSGNRLISVSFYSADPDAILKAYLERFPSSETRPTENPPNRPPEPPSLANLPVVQLVSAKQVLILHQCGEYVPGDVRAGKKWPPQEVARLRRKASGSQTYSVKYIVPGTPLSQSRLTPTVEVQVEEYSNAAWAQYELFQHTPNLANSPKPIKFGSRIYGHAMDAAIGQNGFYTWTSKNRVIILSFSCAEPDEILKAYLEKYPVSEKATPEEVAAAQAPTERERMLILHQFGVYVPGRPYSGTTVQPPVAKYYSVRYALPGAPTMGKTGPVVDVEIYEYPTAAWAQYEIFERGGQTDLANPARPVKFGSRIYGGAKAAPNGQNGTYTNGQNGFYTWASGNRLIVMRFYFSEPDEVLKAYLEKFPPSSADGP